MTYLGMLLYGALLLQATISFGSPRGRRWIPSRMSDNDYGVDQHYSFGSTSDDPSHTSSSSYWSDYFGPGDYTGMLYRAGGGQSDSNHGMMDPVQQLQNVQAYSYAQSLRQQYPYGSPYPYPPPPPHGPYGSYPGEDVSGRSLFHGSILNTLVQSHPHQQQQQPQPQQQPQFAQGQQGQLLDITLVNFPASSSSSSLASKQPNFAVVDLNAFESNQNVDGLSDASLLEALAGIENAQAQSSEPIAVLEVLKNRVNSHQALKGTGSKPQTILKVVAQENEVASVIAGEAQPQLVEEVDQVEVDQMVVETVQEEFDQAQVVQDVQEQKTEVKKSQPQSQQETIKVKITETDTESEQSSSSTNSHTEEDQTKSKLDSKVSQSSVLVKIQEQGKKVKGQKTSAAVKETSESVKETSESVQATKGRAHENDNEYSYPSSPDTSSPLDLVYPPAVVPGPYKPYVPPSSYYQYPQPTPSYAAPLNYPTQPTNPYSYYSNPYSVYPQPSEAASPQYSTYPVYGSGYYQAPPRTARSPGMATPLLVRYVYSSVPYPQFG